MVCFPQTLYENTTVGVKPAKFCKSALIVAKTKIVAFSCDCEWRVSEIFLEMSTRLCLNYFHQTLKKWFVRCWVSCCVKLNNKRGGHTLFLTLWSNSRFSLLQNEDGQKQERTITIIYSLLARCSRTSCCAGCRLECILGSSSGILSSTLRWMSLHFLPGSMQTP